MALRKTIFGRQKVKINTFIGGVSDTLNTPALIAAKLGISSSRIKFFSVVGSDIQFSVTGGQYAIPVNAFRNNLVTFFDDRDGNVSALLADCFNGAAYSSYPLAWANFPAVTSFGPRVFSYCNNLTLLTAPKAVSVGQYFINRSAIKNLSFPNLTTCADLAFASEIANSQMQTIYMPKLVNLGPTVANNNVFFNTKIGVTITVKASLQTVNAGSPDGDLVWVSGARGATIIYI